MNQRRIKLAGKPVYGRKDPLVAPMRRAVARPRMGLLQRRLILLVAVVMAAGYGLAQLFAIREVVVVSDQRGEEIKSEVRKLLGEGWTRGNLLTLNEEELASNLQQADPLLRDVGIRRRWFHAITVTTVLKQPRMGWSAGNQKYLIDLDGTVIGVLPAGSTLPVVNDGSNLPVKVGQKVTTSRFVAFVVSLVPALAANGISVLGLDITDTTLDLTVSTNKGYRMVFDTSRSAGEEMGDLKAVQALLASQKRVPAEYIDLRIAGKAYYK